jgi:serine/threonine protein kinase
MMAMQLESGEFAFSLHETIGVGATGKVKLGVHRETGQRVAVKIVSSRLFQEKPELLRKVLRECDIMGEVAHPHVVRFLGKFETSSCLYLVLELVVGGELFDYLLKTGRQTEDQARKLFRQLISAVHYCHERNVWCAASCFRNCFFGAAALACAPRLLLSHARARSFRYFASFVCLLRSHRDIKPENLLLDEGGNMKVADFGYAQWMHSASDGSSGWVETSCGSPHYASPEVIVGDRYVGNQADVWSCGVVLFALMTGGLPFDDENIQKLLHKVKRGVYQIPSFVPPEARDLIWRMLTVDPAQRITTAQIQQHPWFVGAAPAPAPAVEPEATRQVGRFSLTGGAAAVPQPEAEPAAPVIAPIAEDQPMDQVYSSSSAQQLSPLQRQAIERLQAAQAAAAAALAAPAEDPVTHYLQQSASRQQLAVARHELAALRDLRSEMQQQPQDQPPPSRGLGGDAAAAADPRAEVARLEQMRTADELATVRGEVRLLQQELGLPNVPPPGAAAGGGGDAGGAPPPIGGSGGGSEGQLMPPPPPPVAAPAVAGEDGGGGGGGGSAGGQQDSEAPPGSLWARLGLA